MIKIKIGLIEYNTTIHVDSDEILLTFVAKQICYSNETI